MNLKKIAESGKIALLASANADCIIAPVFKDKNDNVVVTGTSWGPIWKKFTTCKNPDGSSGAHGSEDGRNGFRLEFSVRFWP